MTKQSRRKFTADFKSKIVIEALKERSTIEELAKKYEVHPPRSTPGNGSSWAKLPACSIKKTRTMINKKKLTLRGYTPKLPSSQWKMIFLKKSCSETTW